MKKSFITLLLAAVLLCAGCAQNGGEVVDVGVELRVTSPAFEHNSTIPVKYTCDGEDINPPLHIEGIPENARSLVLVVDDPDAPMGVWDHWIVWNIPPTEGIEEDNVPGMEGLNDFQGHSYGGPCPPSGTHRYSFRVYALDTELDLDLSSEKSDVFKAMQDHILAYGELIGLYGRD